MEIIQSEGLIAKSWCRNIEQGAIDQITNLCSLPFAFHHIAIMPDCHQGYGMPIGGVLATEGVVIPNAVGVDIGCGMCAVKTSIKASQLDQETIKRIFGGSKEYQGGIRCCVPVGMSHQSKRQDESLMPGAYRDKLTYPIVTQEYESALKQLGTLGGGNHFIEIQKDTEDNVWIMIHSGSRNIGFTVANHYNKLAIELNEKWFSSVPKKWELAFLPIDSPEGQDYLSEMQYCVEFALANRKLMMENIKKVIQEEYDKQRGVLHIAVEFGDMINIAHNYAIMEHHFGRDVMVHRKGATLAREGTIGIIPGSQGTKSYIVEGLGNPESFNSCSHGAGRKMGRKQAQKNLNLEEEIKIMNDKGIVHGIRSAKDLDEASGAYKNIDEVMESQQDLVKTLVELSPMAVIKGD
jgi:tRNA-splicing ligase RtcB (3'-phosphate/5'-hydroxy nucleic acid ligase)